MVDAVTNVKSASQTASSPAAQEQSTGRMSTDHSQARTGKRTQTHREQLAWLPTSLPRAQQRHSCG
ncbi:rCG50781 [Rattus norvegicus]|uniref:RCG50781 n=1 Tax=Rattus norvegicus TaxID=10116 RepID=A6KCI2_RAT|nr:rCG50781 [Rattus norvegicus]